MPKKIDLTWRRFGRLVVVHPDVNIGTRTRWVCRCDCGNTLTVDARNLTSGNSKSCGCLKIEKSISRLTKHGGKGTRLYSIWKGLKERCYNKNKKNYHIYGGRGIFVCDRWKDSFEAFRDWAMTSGYTDMLSIDRIDNNGPYSPENCRWATRFIQNRNKTTTRWITHKGKTLTLSGWAKILGLSASALHERIKKYGIATALSFIKIRKGEEWKGVGGQKNASERSSRVG